MPYSPHSYGLVPMPPPFDVGRTLADLAQYANANEEAKYRRLETQRLQQQMDETAQLARGRAAVDAMGRGDQLPPGDVGPRQQSYTVPELPSYLTPGRLYDIPKMNEALASGGLAHLAPDLLKGAEAANESTLKVRASMRAAENDKTVDFGNRASNALRLMKLGTPAERALDLAVQGADHIDQNEYATFKTQLLGLPPDQQQGLLSSLMDRAANLGGGENIGKDTIHVDRYGRTVASNIVPDKLPQPTEWSTLNDLSSPDPVVRARAEKAVGSSRAPIQAPIANPETVRHNRELERIAGLREGREAAMQDETRRHNLAMEGNAGDEQELPRGVSAYLATLVQKTTRSATGQETPYSFADAQADVARTWPDLVRDHPKLDAAKVNTALRGFFSQPSSGFDFLGAPAPTATPQPAAAAPSARPQASGPTKGDIKPIPGYPGAEQTFNGTKWIRTK